MIDEDVLGHAELIPVIYKVKKLNETSSGSKELE